MSETNGRVQILFKRGHISLGIGIFLCVVLLAGTRPQYVHANLVFNGNFESGTIGWTEGFEEASIFHSGAKSLRVEDHSTTEWVTTSTEDLITTSPDSPYLLEVWARGTVEDQAIEIGVLQYQYDADSNMKWIPDNNKVINAVVGTQWTLVRGILNDFHPDAVSVGIFLSPTDYTSDGIHQGTAYFDDVQFISYRYNLIENGDFENGDSGWYGGGMITTSMAHSGGASMVIDDSSTTETVQVTTREYLPVLEDHGYLLQAWVRGTEAEQSVQLTVSQFSINPDNEKGELIHISGKNFDPVFTVGTDWTRLIFPIEALDAKAQWVSISIRPAVWNPEGTSTGKAYFDDVSWELYDGNLLINSSFEYGSTGWAGGNIQIAGDMVHSGTGSLLVEDNDREVSICAHSTEFTPVVPDLPYLLQSWIRGEGATQSVLIAINQYDGNKNWISGKNIDHVVAVDTQWRLFREVIRDLDSNASYIQVSLYPAGWSQSGDEYGKAWFDDVMFIPYRWNLIENGGFEYGHSGWQGGEISNDGHRGEYSLQILDASASMSIYAGTEGIIPIAGDEPYSLTAWIKTSDPSQPMQISLNQFDSGGNWISDRNMDFSVEGTSEWTCFQTFIDEFDPRATDVRAYLRPVQWTDGGERVGSAQFDQVDFRLENKLMEGTWLPTTGGMQFWWAPPDLKVQRGHILDQNASSDVVISLSAARGEGESFQLVMVPQQVDILTNAWTTDLTGPGTISSSSTEFREVAYVPIVEPTDQGSFQGCEKPDPLPALGEINLKAGVQQPLWITIQVPKGISAGDYRGNVVMQFNKAGEISIPIELTVWDFDLPEEHHLRTAYGLSLSQIDQYHHLNGNPDNRRTILRLYLDEFASHRISPVDPIGDDWYQLVFTNLNWFKPDSAIPTPADFVADPDPAHPDNSVMLVYDNDSSKYIRAQSTDRIYPDLAKDYKLEWDVRVGGPRAVGDTGYLISINQYNADGSWLGNIDFNRNAGSTDAWVYRQNGDILRTEWNPSTEYIIIIFYPNRWRDVDVEDQKGAAWFDNFEFREASDTVNLASNPGFDPVDADKLEVHLEAKKFDEAARYAFNLGFDSLYLNLPYFGTCSGVTKPKLLGWEWGTQDYADAYENLIDAISNHMQSNGWLDKSYTYWCDEPKQGWLSDVMYGMEILGNGAPDLHRLLTLNISTDANLINYVDIWVPQTTYYNSAFARERQAVGDEYWWYVSAGVYHPYSNNFIDYAGIDIRSRFWSAWKYGIEGSLYWQTTYWTNSLPCTNCQDPWRDAQSYTSTNELFGNGDGRLLYPPRNWQSATGPLIEGPVPSQRWELIRESIEDYEYFWMLRDAKDRLKALNPSDPLVATAEDLLSIPEGMITSLTEYENDPGVYADYRADAAQVLVKILAKAPPPAPTPTYTPTNTATPMPMTITPSVTPSPTPTFTATPTLVTMTPSSTPSPTPTMTATPRIVTITPWVTPSFTPTATATPKITNITPTTPDFFIDVPQDHWAYAYIKTLYDHGYVKGCSTMPLAYCPTDRMRRDEASVFVDRGVNGAEYYPLEPTEQLYADVIIDAWHAKWITALENGGYTDGCGLDDVGRRIFCPYDVHTRAEATVFFLRMLYGPDFQPPPPSVDRAFIYDDVPVQGSLWFPKWVYAAYDAGLVEGCEDETNQGDLLFRPDEAITRAEAACMMAHAVGLD